MKFIDRHTAQLPTAMQEKSQAERKTDVVKDKP